MLVRCNDERTPSTTEGCSSGNVPYFGVFLLPCCKEACQSEPAYPNSMYIQLHILETLCLPFAWCSFSSFYLRHTAVYGCSINRLTKDTGFVVCAFVHCYFCALIRMEPPERCTLLKKSQHIGLGWTFY